MHLSLLVGRSMRCSRIPSDDRFAFYLRLTASELVKNAVLYGSEREPIHLDLKLFQDWAELRVQNGGARLSMKSLREQRRQGGRGLEIVDALADALVDRHRRVRNEDRGTATGSSRDVALRALGRAMFEDRGHWGTVRRHERAAVLFWPCQQKPLCRSSGARSAGGSGQADRTRMDFRLTTADLGDGVASVAILGEVDLSTAPELKEALAEVTDGGARGVLVDLSNATFIDSTTLGVLMGAVKRLRPLGGELAIACHDPNIRKIFEITMLDRVFNIFDTSDAGIAHLREQSGRRSVELNRQD